MPQLIFYHQLPWPIGPDTDHGHVMACPSKHTADAFADSFRSNIVGPGDCFFSLINENQMGH